MKKSVHMRRCSGLCLLARCIFPVTMSAQMISAPLPQAGTILGTVEDLNGGLVPGATITIQGGSGHSVTADGEGFLSLADVPSATPVHLVVRAEGFQDWTSAAITLSPGRCATSLRSSSP